jgi:uncharacterized protein YceK
MQKKTTIQRAMIVLSILIMSGCSGKSHNSKEQSDTSTKIVACQEENQDQGRSHAITLPKGATLHPTKPKTRLHLWHLKTGERKACVATGEAEVR